VTIIFVVSVCLFLSCLWSDFDQASTYVICLGLVVSPRIQGLCDPWGLGDPLKTCIFRGFGAQKTILSYGFDWIVLIFSYIVERTNTKIPSSHFFCSFHFEPKLWHHKWCNFRFCESCCVAMRFSPLDSWDDFMGRGGLRFSLSVIVSEVWRHKWRHNERCGLHPQPWTT